MISGWIYVSKTYRSSLLVKTVEAYVNLDFFGYLL